MDNKNSIQIISTSKFIQSFGLMFFKYKKDTTKILVTSPKCGTRYLSNLCENNSEFFRFHPAEVSNDENDYYFDNITEIYWIVRPVMEHLLSAIMTEHASNMDSIKNPNKTSSKLKIKKDDEKWKFSILETLLNDILTEPKFTINSNDLVKGWFSHYKPKYEILYNEISNRLDLFSKIKFVELQNLSELIESEFKIYVNSENEKYAMDRFFTKESLLETLQSDFTNVWDELKKIIDNEQYYYDKLLNYDYDNLFNEKINEAYKELDDVYDKLKKHILIYSKYKIKNIKNNINTIKKQLIIN